MSSSAPPHMQHFRRFSWISGQRQLSSESVAPCGSRQRKAFHGYNLWHERNLGTNGSNLYR